MTEELINEKYINLALQKANKAVEYDTSNDFQNAISAYLEAVELLVCVLQQPNDEDSDTKGLESICIIYRERIQFLQVLEQQQVPHATQVKLRRKNAFPSFIKTYFTKKKRHSTEFSSLNDNNKLMNEYFDIQPKPSQSLPTYRRTPHRKHSLWRKNFCI